MDHLARLACGVIILVARARRRPGWQRKSARLWL